MMARKKKIEKKKTICFWESSPKGKGPDSQENSRISGCQYERRIPWHVEMN